MQEQTSLKEFTDSLIKIVTTTRQTLRNQPVDNLRRYVEGLQVYYPELTLHRELIEKYIIDK